MNSNDKQLQIVKNNILSKILNKIKSFFLKKNNVNISINETQNDKLEKNIESSQEEKLIKLEEEYVALLRERDSKLEELNNIIIKDLKITLKIYQLEEQELSEIKELAQDELNDLIKEYEEYKKHL